MPEALKDSIIRHEGFTPSPKPDAKGMYEIGYGHDLTAIEAAQPQWAKGISDEDASGLLDADIAAVKAMADKCFTWLSALNPARSNVIYEMCYQLGIGGVGEFHKMIIAAQKKNWLAASDNMLFNDVPTNRVWTAWHNETPERCEELANIMLNG